MVMLNLTDASIYLRKQGLKDYCIYLKSGNTIEIHIKHFFFNLNKIKKGVSEKLGNSVNWRITKMSFWGWLCYKASQNPDKNKRI
jgi:hypothetical protein